ncbi:MAG: SMC family ATPase [Chloroflexota bacterium]
MIPIQLRIAGFLSYRDPVEIDFREFDLACISGSNGAGKSSLLDSVTWVLFGEARGKSSEVINLSQDVKAADVSLTFEYEGNVYRVQRSLPRNKSTVLEFQVQNGDGWRPLTERSTRETQARIEQTLRLDYETFVNASFFLQGKADQFTQQNPTRRKEVLGSILGLEIWETYKVRTAEKRKVLEEEVNSIDGRLAEIDLELAEEDARKSRLKALDANLNQLAAARIAQETLLVQIKKLEASLDQQRKHASTLSASLERSRASLAGLQSRLDKKDSERAGYSSLIQRAKEIEASYKAWQKARDDLEKFNEISVQFREHEKKRQPLLQKIGAEKARIEQERMGLEDQERVVKPQILFKRDLEKDIDRAKKSLAETEEKLEQRSKLEEMMVTSRERLAELKAENERLKIEMDSLKSRIDSLKVAAGAVCPLCGQDLSEEHRKSTLKEMQEEGKSEGDLYRSNQAEMNALLETAKDSETQIAELAVFDRDRIVHSNAVTQLTERYKTSLQQIAEWKDKGAKRLKEVSRMLQTGKYADDVHAELAQIDGELAKLGYDPAAHEQARQLEIRGRGCEKEHNSLQTARAVIKQIDGEISSLKSQIKDLNAEIARQQKDFDKTASALAEAESQAPSLDDVERELFRLREQENLVRDEVGMARQRVDILATLRTRRVDYASQREELLKQIVQHKTLERAFGKDGVPALLIEQALPQIESRANDLLDRLSNGQMSIRFVTQAEYKDKRREDLRETLDIQISDSVGIRGYEMYSGGEAFRVNFAIRLALSEILAQRKGARLQTLVIDEGFGSQDVQGRQRLIEAINLVKDDFAKILVITHLDELKDVFPNRIEVEKTEQGSTVKVI